MVNSEREYISQRVLTASPLELVCILYQTAIQAVDRSIEALHSGDIIERGRGVSKAIEVLAELQSSLRHDVQKEYSRTLAELYAYIRTQLMRAHAEQSLSQFQEVSRLLNTLAEGWAGAMQLESARGEMNDKNEDEPAAMFSAANPYSGHSPQPGSVSRSWQL